MGMIRRCLGRSRRGQAITEFALIAPIAMLLILGAFDVSIMATDTGLAVGAVRHGSRLAAVIGGNNNNNTTCTGTLNATTYPDTATKDQDHLIISTVLAVTANMSFMGGVGTPGTNAPKGQPEEIIIYRTNWSTGNPPVLQSNADGTLKASTDHYNRYVWNDSFLTPTSANADGASGSHSGYPLSERCQGPLPYDGVIGVRLQWYYQPANGIPGPSFLLTNYAVERLSLCTQDCNPPAGG